MARSSVAECMSIMQKVLGSILGVGTEKFLEAHSYPLYELTGVWASLIPLLSLTSDLLFLTDSFWSLTQKDYRPSPFHSRASLLTSPILSATLPWDKISLFSDHVFLK